VSGHLSACATIDGMTNVTNRPSDDPWAQREASFRLYVEPPAVAFFIPGIDDPAEAEAQWARFAQGHRPDSRRVYSLTYTNGISKIEVKVGEERILRRPETGPRGGHLPGGGLSPVARPTGSRVLAIVDAGTVLEVWSEPPPGEWANPSLVSSRSLEQIQYFRAPGAEGDDTP
jgi:hypothetical protein